MTDEHTSPHVPDEDGFPAFICPACGYFCTITWETSPFRPTYWLDKGMVAQVEVAIMRGAPLRTVCVHPDGSSSYGGGDIANSKSRSVQLNITPAQTRQLLEAVHPITDIITPKDIEDTILIALAGPIADNFVNCVSPADCPEVFARVYDRLGDLPETSPLALLVDEDDPALIRIQELVIDLLNSRDYDLKDALMEVMKERHFLTPADIRALIEAQKRGDEGSGLEY